MEAAVGITYWAGVFVYATYVYFRKTDASQHQVLRRLITMVHAIFWPIALVIYGLMGALRGDTADDTTAASARILGGGQDEEATAPIGGGRPRIRDPFEDA